MAREASVDQGYKILAYLTANPDRKISGAPLFFKASDEAELKEMTGELATVLKADAVRLKNKDYLIIQVGQG